MAKVIGIDEKKIRHVSCNECASKIEYTNSELVERKYNCDYTGDCDIGMFLTCPNPNCSHHILIK